MSWNLKKYLISVIRIRGRSGEGGEALERTGGLTLMDKEAAVLIRWSKRFFSFSTSRPLLIKDVGKPFSTR